MLADNVQKLAIARQETEQAKSELAQLVAEFDARPDVVQLRNHVKALQAQVEMLDGFVRENALEAYGKNGNKTPHPAVKIRVMKAISYEVADAFAWCHEHLTAALKLDTKLFEKHAKAVEDTTPLGFVYIIDEPQVAIDRDLSEYI